MTQPQSTTVSAAAKRRQDNQTSVKETLESILVAFILAFIFRAFVVEAFVIPTGSMAPTLLGANMRFHCNDCGYQFTVNYSSPPSKDNDIIIRDTADVSSVTCPNCGYSFPTLLDSADPTNTKQNHPVHYGDRILVLKYLYLLEHPQRWDVVVFKSPRSRARSGSENLQPTYTQNYIKRLIATPGESSMILDGDIYIGKKGHALANFVSDPDQAPLCAGSDVAKRSSITTTYFPVGVEHFDGTVWKQPWAVQGGSGWTLGKSPADRRRSFTSIAPADQSTIFFDKDANPNTNSFTDWMAYDTELSPGRYNHVRVLKLNFFYQRQSGDGHAAARRRGDGKRINSPPCLRRHARSLSKRPTPATSPSATRSRSSAGSEPVHVEADQRRLSRQPSHQRQGHRAHRAEPISPRYPRFAASDFRKT